MYDWNFFPLENIANPVCMLLVEWYQMAWKTNCCVLIGAKHLLLPACRQGIFFHSRIVGWTDRVIHPRMFLERHSDFVSFCFFLLPDIKVFFNSLFPFLGFGVWTFYPKKILSQSPGCVHSYNAWFSDQLNASIKK